MNCIVIIVSFILFIQAFFSLHTSSPKNQNNVVPLRKEKNASRNAETESAGVESSHEGSRSGEGEARISGEESDRRYQENGKTGADGM